MLPLPGSGAACFNVAAAPSPGTTMKRAGAPSLAGAHHSLPSAVTTAAQIAQLHGLSFRHVAQVAALSVPDWPQSFGTWFPTLSMLAGGAFFEHSHRVIAG